MNLLGGLKQKRNTNAGQAAYGRSMANQANLNLSKEQDKSDFSAKKFAADQDARMKESGLKGKRSTDHQGLRVDRAGLASRKAVFDQQMKDAYDLIDHRKKINFKQALINQAARHFT